MSFDIDDDDREYFYRKHGRPKPPTRWNRLRRSRFVSLATVMTSLVFLYYLLFKHREPTVDWSRYAYTLYATDTQTLCNAYMVFDALKRYGSKADRILQYPQQWDTVIESELDRNSQLLVRMQKHHKVKLLPVELQGASGTVWPGTLNQEANWDTSITKLSAFELTVYERVLHIDSDVTLFDNLDELFSLPITSVAMPRAYWMDVPPPTREGAQPFPLTSLLILLKPNQKDFKSMMNLLQQWREEPDFEENKRYDMEVLNHRFGASAMVLPQRPYALLSSEFRLEDHSRYMGDANATWDPEQVLEESKLVHFSDWPIPKPWYLTPSEALAELQPKCLGRGGAECLDRKIWKGLYDDFRRRRKDLCGILSVPAPKWDKWKADHGAGTAKPTQARVMRPIHDSMMDAVS